MMQIIQNVLILLAMPMFLFGACGIAENVADGNLVPTLISVGLFIGSFVLFGLGLLLNKAVEIWKATTTDSAKRKMHHKIYELLVNNGYDTNVALDIATKIINIYHIR